LGVRHRHRYRLWHSYKRSLTRYQALHCTCSHISGSFFWSRRLQPRHNLCIYLIYDFVPDS